MTTIIVLFNLKDTAQVSEYESWAKTTDIPTASGLPSVDKFAVLKAEGLLMSEDNSPYQYIEILEINDMEQFGKDASSAVMQKVAGEFQSFADNPLFIMTSKIEA
ncbi:REDY-like protein HapK [Psychrosphaera sp. F3M07]|uniref:REDY-like protein HapK n=1 Tax=Psychrosphaera sp. F3M07 TaxID=2841560 RepID=UPI001C09979B|nr:REDY-like protein HapK [Psychrosphaera sp. F3M07]MBU2919619.1 REDY-like protein HapK [Psychrosphaera sp. F3M07]